MPSSVARIHKRHSYGKDAHTYYPVLVIGAGVSGIATGCRLKEALGFDQFRIFERQSGIGGTWWINRYPGAACDVPALLYSFSFAPKKDWTTLHPPGPEIVQYLADVCEKYQIVDKIQLNTAVKELRWLEDAEEWQVTLLHLVPGIGDLSEGERDARISKEGERSVYVKTEIVRAKIVVSGVGVLVEPKKWPASVPGIETFEGEVVHTARWKSDLDLSGKNVVIIGSGCSATQVVSELTKPEYKIKSITQLMRSPAWFMPDLLTPKSLKKWEKYTPPLFKNVPGLAFGARALLFFFLEWDFLTVFKDNEYSRRNRSRLEREFLEHMRATAPEKYHDILIPNYSLGCKRRIVESNYYASIHAPNFELTTKPLVSVQARSVTLGPGRHYPPESKESTDGVRQIPADVIILANGYETNKFLHPLPVFGRRGKTLDEIWEERGGAQAYLGIAMDHMPNLFLSFGPNTATGHTSVIFAVENAINYSLNFIKPILEGRVSCFEVKENAERDWTDKVQRSLQGTVFRRGACTSWYQTDEGWNSSTYPFTQIDYYLRCTFPMWHHWTAKYTRKGLMLERMKTVLRRFALVAIISGLCWLKMHPKDTQRLVELFSGARTTIVSAIREGLLRFRRMLS
ncbi:flavin-containing monooxygenase [Aspergillus fischeri NRRL 181]|uniref:Flavin-binding monooxygenase, putative n=1 Tax=Neosartorya fischeri (strain ATCC 1020 / DSM 3700 / CBS 544.65 / FGSC A1164 / JCM 1740 / NRRL 181 / WB 181) TaxID=331117 RepID=A1CXZ8_NEOFI|nr:flavin-binding monooxygenase, putative [Aspergillus fischeri NRRL 181]EAW25500.1 flavin-binding monooxygenase, putative [Aspergillus fischeri NRRL 181]